MRVKPVEEISETVPIVKIRSNDKCAVAASSESLVILEGAPPALDARATKLTLRAIDVDVSPDCIAAAVEDGCLLIRTTEDDSSPIRVEVCPSDELRCVCVHADSILLGASRFVLALSLQKILETRKDPWNRDKSVTLHKSWGKQHALHTEPVTDIAVSSDGNQIVSVGEDGLICVARAVSMDPLQPEMIRGEAGYDDEFNDGADDLMTLCIGVGMPIRQLLLIGDIVTVLCDTHQIAAYSLGCLNSDLTDGNRARTLVALRRRLCRS